MKKRAAVIISILIVMGLLIGGCGGADQSTPEGAVESYMKAFQKGDADQLWELTDPEEREYIEEYFGGKKEFIESISMMLGMIKINSYRINDVQLTGEDTAEASVTIKMSFMGDTEEETERFRLVRRGGNWYMADFW